MNPIQKILQEFPVMILDGAMATELEKYDCNINDPLWSAKILMENPELIKKVHLDYFKAGADCAITASYQATVEGFKERGLNEDEAIGHIKLSVQLAIEARDEYLNTVENKLNRPLPLIVASIGPYGAYLADGSEYRGDYAVTEDELIDFHRARIKAVIDAGADILACETIPCLMEAKAIVKLLKEFPGVYAWISFSAKDNLHISNGEAIEECTKWLDREEQVAAIGINCTSPEYIPSLIKGIQHHTDKPIVVYPNSGEEYNVSDKSWHQESTKEIDSCSSQEWFKLGARLIGGCCRTNPDDIKAIAAWSRK